MRWAAAVVFTAGAALPAHSEKLPSTSPHLAPATGALEGCCTDADVMNYGNKLDFGPWPRGVEVTDQLENRGLRFGRGASPYAPRTLIDDDYSRSSGCKRVVSGDPSFDGWEFFVFVDSLENRWAKVKKVGVQVGYCDNLNTVFIAAYDANGVLLEAKFNDRGGYQFLGIERPSADICQVMIGDCSNIGTQCYSDPFGSAFNCLTYSTPISTPTALPDTIQFPPPPLRFGTPAAGPGALALLGLLLSGAALWAFRKDRGTDPGERASRA